VGKARDQGPQFTEAVCCPGEKPPDARLFLSLGGRLVFLAVLGLNTIALQAQSDPAASSRARPPVGDKASEGDRVCKPCHEKIYESYEQTAMAHASGPSHGNLIVGEFTHERTHVHYRVYEQDGKVWLSFDRSGNDEIHGRRELLYFIGSGKRGRTYVFEEQGFFFESPVNWYGQKGVWDMTPAYQDADHIPLNLPLSAECLSCHTSVSQDPAPGTQSKYDAPILTDEGIACSRCHGSGEAHAKSGGPILNPAKLAATKRDAVCMQCHLEGSVAIRQPGRRLGDYKPGEDLQGYVHYYVLVSQGPGLPAISQFEALYQSQCKQKFGDAMSCMSCHDPHATPGASEKVEYYRSKCIACHGEGFASRHHAKERNCVACHMPEVTSSNVAHTQATDHRILRKPPGARASAPGGLVLQRFPPSREQENQRDVALAWQSLAEAGMPPAVQEAETHLRRAVMEWPNDATLLAALGFLEQRRGQIPQAKAMYERALEKDPLDSTAATDLGVIEAQTGNVRRAIALWGAAFERQPGRSAIGINLSRALCAEGKPNDAKETLQQVLEFNPDLPEARKMLVELSAHPPKCGAD